MNPKRRGGEGRDRDVNPEERGGEGRDRPRDEGIGWVREQPDQD